MESREKNPFLTPTYQTIFIMDLRQVNECFFYGDYQGSFEALRILYSDLLEKPRREIEKDWNEFLALKKAIQVNNGNLARKAINHEKAQNNFLYLNIPVIKAKFIQVLEKNNLLNLETGAKPKYSRKGHLKIPS